MQTSSFPRPRNDCEPTSAVAIFPQDYVSPSLQNLPEQLDFNDRNVAPPDYEIIRELGRGGMGVVYLANQRLINRQVALKMILAGTFANPEQRMRFLIEGEIAARVRHPNVVQVYEVGIHQGRPFIALEYVPGGTLFHRMRRQKTSFNEAAVLVEQMARAVHAAHVQGVIHRDLKPGNVLLNEDGTLKITDFGVAKCYDSDGSLTASGMAVGTPDYMSPEQAEGIHQLTPASDIYSLGVIFYELLAGRTPFKGDAPMAVMQQVVRGNPPTPRNWVKTLPRDLEIICLKCLEREPGKRYASAEHLADDLERWLSHEPILARPVGRREKAWRWIRRNPVTAILSASLVILLVTSLLAMTKLYWDADQARDRAEIAELKARKALAGTEALNEFVLDRVLKAARPLGIGQGKDVTMRAVQDEAAPYIEKSFPGQPEIEARLHQSLGNTYYSLGHYSSALDHLAKAYELLKQHGTNQERYLALQIQLVEVKLQLGKVKEMEPVLRALLIQCRQDLGASHHETRRAESCLASCLKYLGQFGEAEQLLRRLVNVDKQLDEDRTPEHLLTIVNLAELLRDTGRPQMAETEYVALLPVMQRVVGKDHPETLRAQSDYARTLKMVGKLDEAEKLFRLTIDQRKRINGEDHPSTLFTMNSLALLLLDRQQYPEAESLFKQILAVYGKQPTQKHQAVSIQLNLASLLLEQNRHVEAEPLCRDILTERQNTLPQGHWQIANSKCLLGACLYKQRKYDEAEKLGLAAFESYKKAEGIPPRRLDNVMCLLIDVYTDWDKPDEAQRWRNTRKQMGFAAVRP
ncbi:MAG: serine/threonine-protein kinase [Gemmatales bacterium]